MRQESIQPSLITKHPFNFNTLIALLCGIVILAHFLSSFFPESRLWGINHLAYFPLWVRVGFTLLGLLILLPVINLKVAQILERFFSFLSKVFAGREVIGASLLSLVFIHLFWLIRTRTHFLGDGYLCISQLKSEKYLNIGFKPLDVFSHLYLYKFLKLFFSPSAEFVYSGLSILVGGIFVFVLFFLMKTLTKDKFDRFFVFSLFLFSGATELFLGYVEHYTLVYVSTFTYLYFSLRYLQGKASILLPILLFLLSICLHFSSIFLLLSLFFLFTLSRKKGGMVFSLKKAFPYILTFIFLFGFSMYYVWSTYPVFSEIFVPLLKGGVLAPGYTSFSVPHLLDILNQHLLVSPVGLILLLSLSLTYKGIIKFKDPIIAFLFIVSINQISFHFMVDPKFGAVRDWDLFSNVALGYTFLGTYTFVSLSKFKRYSAIVLIFTCMLSIFPWFLLNANSEKAIDRFDNLLDLDPKRNWSGRYILAEYYSQMKRYQEEQETWSRVFSLFPEDSLTRIAESLIKSGDHNQAQQLLKKAIEINPSFHEAHGGLGRTYLMQGDVDKALEEFQIAVRLNPFNRFYRVNLGFSLLHKGRLRESLSEFKKAEKLGSIPIYVYRDMGYILYDLGEIEKAMEIYQKALKMDPEYYEVHFELGKIYLEKNFLKQALVEFNQVLRLAPDFAPVYYHLGLVYSMLGSKEKALENFELFLKNSSDEPEKEQVKEWIRGLRSQD